MSFLPILLLIVTVHSVSLNYTNKTALWEELVKLSHSSRVSTTQAPAGNDIANSSELSFDGGLNDQAYVIHSNDPDDIAIWEKLLSSKSEMIFEEFDLKEPEEEKIDKKILFDEGFVEKDEEGDGEEINNSEITEIFVETTENSFTINASESPPTEIHLEDSLEPEQSIDKNHTVEFKEETILLENEKIQKTEEDDNKLEDEIKDTNQESTPMALPFTSLSFELEPYMNAEPQSEGSQTSQGTSLGFVFDSTGSMNDELKQVKIGASKIMAAMMNHPHQPVYNYILVPFNDPVVGPVTVTTDHRVLKDRLNEIQVAGGGDCPEMSVSAIIKALEVSLPNSYIYVFTDAYAKDHERVNEALALIQKKQSLVEIVMTDECSASYDRIGYEVYEKIAATSCGQVYRLNKSEVIDVLQYVKGSLQSQKVTLLSENKPAPPPDKPDEHELFVDESVKEFTVSVSGRNASIGVTDPKGRKVDGPPQLEPLLTLKNVKVVNVKEPDPGPWKVTIGSDSDYALRSTGVSGIDFVHGFSVHDTNEIESTSHRPLKGTPNFVLIETSKDHVGNLTKISIVGLDGIIREEIPLEPVPGKPGIYKGVFIPPQDIFYLCVNGYGKDGLPIKRISATAVSSQLPAKPVVLMAESLTVMMNQPVTIHCQVESMIPFTLQWHKNGNPLGETQQYPQTCEALWTIERVNEYTEGHYTCFASNVAGNDSQQMFLNVTDHPPRVEAKNVIGAINTSVLLHCAVQSNLKYKVEWSRLLHGVHENMTHGYQLNNNSWLLDSVTDKDVGWYACTVTNKGGRNEARIHLTISAPIQVTLNPTSLIYKTGDNVLLNCTFEGKPQPVVSWFKDGMEISGYDSAFTILLTSNTSRLEIDFADKSDEGVYECVAANNIEAVKAMVTLHYGEEPSISAEKNNLMVKNGSEALLKCMASGLPRPNVKWFRSGIEIENNEHFQVTSDGHLKITEVFLSDGGEFSCVAENSIGRDADFIGLFVGTPPTFIHHPRDKKVEIGRSTSIPCSVISTPASDITWKRIDGRPLDVNRMTITQSGSLKITNSQAEDEGTYECTAENMFGKIQAKSFIHITGIVKPFIDNSLLPSSSFRTITGDSITIPCQVVLGNPRPTIVWYRNGHRLSVGKQGNKLHLDLQGNLVVSNVESSDRGQYECRVSNVGGTVTSTFDLEVSEPPKIAHSNQTEYRVKKGERVLIPCPMEGDPKPSVSWLKDGSSLLPSPSIYQQQDGTLVIEQLTVNNSGTYVCVGINEAGSVSRATSLHVLVPPEIVTTSGDLELSIVEGHIVTLSCRVAAVPEPTIEWYKNDEKLIQEVNNYTTPDVLRFVSQFEDSGIYKCVASNEAGTAEREFNLTILIPPNSHGVKDDVTVTATAGKHVTLLCNVNGYPAPFIIWRRNGLYLTENTTDVKVTRDGRLIITNVTKDSAGAYICDAENLAGITQKIFYLHVNFPPRIIEEVSAEKPITLREGEKYSLPCLVEGNPKPEVVWKKNGLLVTGYRGADLMILADNTLVLIVVTHDSAGTYTCEATNNEGTVKKEYEIEVLVPPFVDFDNLSTKYEVNEGEALVLICPTIEVHPPPVIQWIKDGKSLSSLLQERSDETPMSLSSDHRSLRIAETHPSDNGNYSCVATNIAGRTDAKFQVDVLMTPHFEEFNHVAHRTILAGGEVVLNCSVSGNPPPQVTWRKGNTPITSYNSPGVVTSLDKQHLIIPRGRIHHSGTYICTATNKVNTKEREFYVNVIEPARITGSSRETIEALVNDKITLNCPIFGIPKPVVKWERLANSSSVLDSRRVSINEDGSQLSIDDADCEDDGIYVCEATNPAGSAFKYFNVSVLQPPSIDDHDITNTIEVPAGVNVTLRCKIRGKPTPSVSWLHNGHIVEQEQSVATRRKREIHNEIALELLNVTENSSGVYTALASNKAGVTEKYFKLKVMIPPKLSELKNTKESLAILQNLPVTLKCPVLSTEPSPSFHWKFNNNILEENVGYIGTTDKELIINMAKVGHTGNYTCVANNTGGVVAKEFVLTVLVPPLLDDPIKTTHEVVVNTSLTLNCNASGFPKPTYLWIHRSTPLKNSSNVQLLNSGQTLVLNQMKVKQSGKYTCIVSNIAGEVEKKYHVEIHEPPYYNNIFVKSISHRKVKLHRRTKFNCPFSGNPTPTINWYKDDTDLGITRNIDVSESGHELTVFQVSQSDIGNYTCVATNYLGSNSISFIMDGVVSAEWSSWSDWSECSSSCGIGYQSRERICTTDNSEDSRIHVDKTDCEGEDLQKRTCYSKECPMNGGWSFWSQWSPCSESCDSGIRRRYRKCDSPSPDHGGSTCHGTDVEEESCYLKPCFMDGGWSDWTSWSLCTDPCEEKHRVRKCNNPKPDHGGQNCVGVAKEVAICDPQKCSDSGIWQPWGDWSACSSSCGTGHRKRVRRCKTSRTGRKCVGDNLEIEKCFLSPCNTPTPMPLSANLHISGKINGNPVDKNIVADIATDKRQTVVSTNTNDILKRQNGWFPYAPFLLSPVQWNTAYETDDADNGFSLTRGRFFSESNVEFATGEGLRLKHTGDGVDEDGTFQVMIEVAGELPVIEPSASVYIKPFDQKFVQTGPNSIYSSMQSDIDIEGNKLPYFWNSSIHYDRHFGTMPYLVEEMKSSNIKTQYNTNSNNVTYEATSRISKSMDADHCPRGFVHDVELQHCEDIDECREEVCHSSQVCENTFGSFICVCDVGYRSSGPGQTCYDIDECLIKPPICSHFCRNLDGSFECSCPHGYRLGVDLKNCEVFDDEFDEELSREFYMNKQDMRASHEERFQFKNSTKSTPCKTGFDQVGGFCIDINECEEDIHDCHDEELCLNTAGTYECVPTLCPAGFHRAEDSLNCYKYCDESGACDGVELGEVISFTAISVRREEFRLMQDIMQLDVEGESGVAVERTRFNVTYPSRGYRIRVTKGRGALYATDKVKANTVHRINVEGVTLDHTGKTLYTTKFMIFLYIIKRPNRLRG